MYVASFTDAWIETRNESIDPIFRPCRMFYRCVDWNIHIFAPVKQNKVASFTDAWIETEIYKLLVMEGGVASFTDAWIETISKVLSRAIAISRIFYRCVDWNSFFCKYSGGVISRIFYRCVDWNLLSTTNKIIMASHLLQMRGLKPKYVL